MFFIKVSQVYFSSQPFLITAPYLPSIHPACHFPAPGKYREGGGHTQLEPDLAVCSEIHQHSVAMPAKLILAH